MFRPGNIGHLGRLGLVAASRPSLVAQALAILAKYGSAANLYLPGVGAISGITAGNWLDTVGGTPATVDGAVGTVVNAIGGANLTQATTANKPILRLSGSVYSWQFDGVNDSLSFTALPFGMSDDHCVIVSAQIASVAQNSDMFAMRSTASSNPIIVLRASTTGSVQALYRDNAQPTVEIISSTSTFALNTQFIAGMRKIGNSKIVRLNASGQAQGNVAFGASTFTGASLGVSPTATPAQYTNGRISSVIAVKGAVTDYDLSVLERWLGSFSGVTL